MQNVLEQGRLVTPQEQQGWGPGAHYLSLVRMWPASNWPLTHGLFLTFPTGGRHRRERAMSLTLTSLRLNCKSPAGRLGFSPGQPTQGPILGSIHAGPPSWVLPLHTHAPSPQTNHLLQTHVCRWGAGLRPGILHHWDTCLPGLALNRACGQGWHSPRAGAAGPGPPQRVPCGAGPLSGAPRPSRGRLPPWGSQPRLRTWAHAPGRAESAASHPGF